MVSCEPTVVLPLLQLTESSSGLSFSASWPPHVNRLSERPPPDVQTRKPVFYNRLGFTHTRCSPFHPSIRSLPRPLPADESRPFRTRFFEVFGPRLSYIAACLEPRRKMTLLLHKAGELRSGRAADIRAGSAAVAKVGTWLLSLAFAGRALLKSTSALGGAAVNPKGAADCMRDLRAAPKHGAISVARGASWFFFAPVYISDVHSTFPQECTRIVHAVLRCSRHCRGGLSVPRTFVHTV